MPEPEDVRRWAVGNGHTVYYKGGFSNALISAYNAAHPADPYLRPELREPSLAALDGEALRRRVEQLRRELELAVEFPRIPLPPPIVGIPTVLTPEQVETLVPCFSASWIREGCRAGRVTHVRGPRGRIGLTADQVSNLIKQHTQGGPPPERPPTLTSPRARGPRLPR